MTSAFADLIIIFGFLGGGMVLLGLLGGLLKLLFWRDHD